MDQNRYNHVKLQNEFLLDETDFCFIQISLICQRAVKLKKSIKINSVY